MPGNPWACVEDVVVSDAQQGPLVNFQGDVGFVQQESVAASAKWWVLYLAK